MREWLLLLLFQLLLTTRFSTTTRPLSQLLPQLTSYFLTTHSLTSYNQPRDSRAGRTPVWRHTRSTRRSRRASSRRSRRSGREGRGWSLEVDAHWPLPFAYQCAATFSAKRLLPSLEGKMGQYALKSLAAHEQLVHGTVSIQHFLIRSEPCLFAGATDPFHCAEVEEYFESLTADGLCGACLEVSRAKRHEAATAFWNELPGVFGLQPREDLRAMK
ncbi:hypothetical protein DFH08DRAFT_387104 [Mycena albidolilacea]|uniref:Uncharacterized protein n=1 Tax=Mycena albidolilacea TaxID=1033008 RepID=A0AAD7EFI1_9AGAR|nr:hypothetical protein DFH08DRAFT_387104 [Mycena albidolilacea]